MKHFFMQMALILTLVMLLSSVGISEDSINLTDDNISTESTLIETDETVASGIIDESALEESGDVDLIDSEEDIISEIVEPVPEEIEEVELLLGEDPITDATTDEITDELQEPNDDYDSFPEDYTIDSDSLEERDGSIDNSIMSFDREFVLENTVFRLVCSDNAFPEDTVLRIERIANEDIIHSTDTSTFLNDNCIHNFYRIEVLDEAGNVTLPNDGSGIPTVFVSHLTDNNNITVWACDGNTGEFYELDASSGENGIEFAFVDSTIYDIVIHEDLQEETAEKPDEEHTAENEPSEDHSADGTSTDGDQSEEETKSDSDVDKSDPADGEQKQNDLEDSKESDDSETLSIDDVSVLSEEEQASQDAVSATLNNVLLEPKVTNVLFVEKCNYTVQQKYTACTEPKESASSLLGPTRKVGDKIISCCVEKNEYDNLWLYEFPGAKYCVYSGCKYKDGQSAVSENETQYLRFDSVVIDNNSFTLNSDKLLSTGDLYLHSNFTIDSIQVFYDIINADGKILRVYGEKQYGPGSGALWENSIFSEENYCNLYYPLNIKYFYNGTNSSIITLLKNAKAYQIEFAIKYYYDRGLKLKTYSIYLKKGNIADYTSSSSASSSNSSSGTTNSSATQPSTPTITVTKNAKYKVKVGTNFQIQLNGATAKSYKSSKRKVASVSSSGFVTPLKPGKTKITVKLTNRKRYTVTLNVYDPTIPTSVSLNMSGTNNVKTGDTVTLTASLPSGTSSGIKWKSNHKSVATVSNGVVKFKKKGSVTITATTTRGNKKAKVKFKVTKYDAKKDLSNYGWRTVTGISSDKRLVFQRTHKGGYMSKHRFKNGDPIFVNLTWREGGDAIAYEDNTYGYVPAKYIEW